MKVDGPGPVPEAWERNVRNAEMPEEMLEQWRQHNSRDIPLTPELFQFFKLLQSRRRRLDGKWDHSVVILTLDKICMGCGAR
eukprot:1365436-Karenia_brevis.AAC.1